MLLGAVLWLAGAEPADGIALATLPVDYETAVPEHVRESIELGLSRGIERSGARPVAITLPDECFGVACLRAVGQTYDVRQMLRPRVEHRDRDYSLTFELVDTRGTVVVSRSVDCELCGVTEVAEATENLAAALATKFQELPRGPGFLVLQTRPSGASVFVDGEVVGQTPMRLTLSPGEHEVVAKLEAHGDAGRQVEAVSGVEERLVLRLLPLDPEPGLASDRGIRAAGWTLFGLGLASIGSGAALWAIDDRPYLPSCPPSGPDAQGRCPERYATLGAGIGLTAAGVVGVGTGLGLVVWRVVQRKRVGARARIQPTSGGVMVRF